MKNHATTLRQAALGGVILLAAACAQAATITWNAAQGITGDSDVSTAGDFAYAFNLAGRTGTNPNYTWVDVTLNGVTFSGTTNTGVANKFSWAVTAGASSFNTTAYMPTYNPAGPAGELSSDYRTLLTSAIRADNATGNVSGAATLTLLGLTVGHEYQVQVWSNDSRWSGDAYANSVSLSSLGGASVTLDTNTATSGGGGLGQYVIGTFVADGASQTISLASLTTTVAGHQGVLINAFQLRDLGAIPEPSAAALLAGVCALAGVAVSRRRR